MISLYKPMFAVVLETNVAILKPRTLHSV